MGTAHPDGETMKKENKNVCEIEITHNNIINFNCGLSCFSHGCDHRIKIDNEKECIFNKEENVLYGHVYRCTNKTAQTEIMKKAYGILQQKITEEINKKG